MSTRRVRQIWHHLARLLLLVLAALAFSTAPARPLHASPLPPPRPGASDATHPLSSGSALHWNTFLGATGYDYANGMALDAAGNIYIAGSSEAAWQGASAPLHAYAGGEDAFVAKLDPSGALIWNTFLGQSGDDYADDIALDASGNIFIIGMSNDTWEGENPPVRDYSASNDVFVAKLSPSGKLEWNTFLGGGGTDQGNGIAVAGDGSIYVAGDGSLSWQGDRPPIRPHGSAWDGFVAKLDSNGALVWNTFLGGGGGDHAVAVTTFGNNAIYVAGDSSAAWQGAILPRRDYSAGDDGYVAGLDADGNLTWNTFLGGSGYDYANDVAVDGDGNIYSTGQSSEGWQGTSLPVRGYSAADDAFAAKLSPTGSLVWNTFLGGSGYDAGTALALNASAIYVAGRGNATWGSPARPHSGTGDAFAADLTLDGSLVWNTFLGGTGDDQAFAVAADGNGNLYIAGVSGATWGSPVRPYTDSDEAFIAQLGTAYLHLPLLRR